MGWRRVFFRRHNARFSHGTPLNGNSELASRAESLRSAESTSLTDMSAGERDGLRRTLSNIGNVTYPCYDGACVHQLIPGLISFTTGNHQQCQSVHRTQYPQLVVGLVRYLFLASLVVDPEDWTSVGSTKWLRGKNTAGSQTATPDTGGLGGREGGRAAGRECEHSRSPSLLPKTPFHS